MAQQLKYDEWKGASGDWYVSDVHTWTRTAALCEIFGVDKDGLCTLLKDKYHAEIFEDAIPLFYFPEYKDAHQFKLDANRIARKKCMMVEKQF